MTTIASTPPVTVQPPTAQPAPAAAKPQATTEGGGNALFKTAADMVEFAENTLDKLTSSLGSVVALRHMLTPEAFEEDRKRYGDERAKKLQALNKEFLGKSERMAQTDEGALRGAFSISGDLIKHDEEGNRTLGRFTLSGKGAGFAVQIDSEKGASVSNNGGPFTSDFTRITPPQLRNLPYLKVIADTLNVKV